MAGTAKLVLASNDTGSAGFAIHLFGCADIGKQRWAMQPVVTTEEIADAIAQNYGGYSDNGDAPVDATQALSWAIVKACAKRAVKEAK